MRFNLYGCKAKKKNQLLFSSSLDAVGVSPALYTIATQLIEQEREEKTLRGLLEEYHFTLTRDSDKGEATILTVQTEGHSCAEALRAAYIRVCGWQGKEPKLIEEVTWALPQECSDGDVKDGQLSIFGSEVPAEPYAKRTRGRTRKAAR